MAQSGDSQNLNQRIQTLCGELATGLDSGNPTRIEDLLTGWQGDERSELLRQLLGVEIENRQARQEDLSVDEFIDRFPNDAALVNIVFAQSEATIGATHIHPGAPSPQDFGEYTVLEKIGEGGMGAVYKARHKRMDRIVAIKLLPPKSLDSPDAVKRFEREVKAAAKLEHQNVVTAYDAGEANGHHYLVMRYVDGENLSRHVKQQGPLPVATAINYIAQTANGLEYAHDEGIIHRDIKPSNLLLDRKGTVKILDMGLARLDSEMDDHSATELTQSGTAMGTVDYMAPEQSADAHTADVRSDIYSLGCTLYYLLTARSVYGGATLFNRMLAHRDQPIPTLTEIRPDIPPAVNDLFRKMVAKEPEHRYQTMPEVIQALRECGIGEFPQPSSSTSGSRVPTIQSAPPTVQGLAPTTTHVKPATGETSSSETSISAVNQQTVIAGGSSSATPATRSRKKLITALSGATAVLLIALLIWFNRPHQTEPSNTGPTNVVDPPGNNPGDEVAAKIAPPPLAKAPFKAEEAKAHQTAWADHLGLPVEKEVDLPDGAQMAFMLIPPGEFQMGSSKEEQTHALESSEVQARNAFPTDTIPTESPQHRVRITRPFYLAKHEVTLAQWQSIMGNNPTREVTKSDHPVNLVSWNDIQPLLTKLNADALATGMEFALPTEAQWEYACRAGTTSTWYFGDDPALLPDYGWFVRNARRETRPVAQWRPNQFGLYDMHGSVWEWCADWFGASFYAESPVDDPVGRRSAGSRRVIRGGGHNWGGGPWHCRSAMRVGWYPKEKLSTIGFRLALTIDSEKLKASEAPSADPDRRAAEWVLGIGGQIKTTAGGFTDVAQLPAGPLRVTRVELSGNKQVTDQNIEHLRGLTALKYLDLSDTQVGDVGLADLKGLTNLISLNLMRTQIGDAGLKHLRNMTKLTTLSLPKLYVTDAGMNHLQGLTKLTSLSVEAPQVGDDGLVHLKGMTNLKFLLLNHTRVGDDGLAHLQGMKKLTSLQLNSTQVGNAGLVHLQKLTNLNSLSLNYSQVSDAGLQHLRGIAYLHLTRTDVGDAGLRYLQRLTTLKTLDLNGTRVGDEGLQHLQVLPELTGLFLHHTDVSDAGLEHLKQMANLTSLALRSTQISDTGLIHLKGLTRLTSLDLMGTKVTDAGLVHLKGLSKLTDLQLTDTQITDIGLQHVKTMENLTYLSLRDTDVTPQGIADLQKALPNCEIVTDQTPPKPANRKPGPKENVIAGIIPRPATIDGMRWQVIPKRPRGGNAVWSPAGEWIAVTDGKHIRLYNSETYQLDRILEGHDKLLPYWKPYSLAWKPDGKWLASGTIGTQEKPAEIRFWNIAEDEDGASVNGGTSDITALAWSHDGNRLASGTYRGDPNIRVWNIRGDLVNTIPFKYDFVDYLAWVSGESKLVALPRTGKLAYCDLEKNESHLSSISADKVASFSPDGNLVSVRIPKPANVADKDHPLIRVIDVRTLEVVADLGKNIPHYANQIVWSPDGTYIAAPGQAAHVYVFDWKKQKQVWTGYLKSPAHRASWSPDGKYILGVGEDRIAHIYKFGSYPFSTPNVIRSLEKQPIASSPRSDFKSNLAFISANLKSIYILDKDGNALPAPNPAGEDIFQLAWHPTEDRLVTKRAENTIQFWNENHELEKTLEGHEGIIYSMAWNPAGTWFVAAGEQKIYFWDQAGVLLKNIDIPISMRTLHWHPDGKLLAGLAHDNSQFFWNADGKLVHQIETYSVRIVKHEFSPDGRVLAVGYQDGTVKFWETDGLTKLNLVDNPVIRTGDSQLHTFAWSPGSKKVVTSGNRHKLLIWSEGQEHPQSIGRFTTHRLTNIFWPADNDGQLITTDVGGNIYKLNIANGQPAQVTIVLPNDNLATFSADGALLSATPGADDELIYVLQRDPDKSLDVFTPEEFRSQFPVPKSEKNPQAETMPDQTNKPANNALPFR